MAKKLYPEENIQAIATAIRSKNGSLETYTVADMADAITAIPTGGTGNNYAAATRFAEAPLDPTYREGVENVD